jgi:tetratricopeptide (TPR) repeat protein
MTEQAERDSLLVAPRHVFVSYVREDADLVEQLADELRLRGVTVWLDKDALKPGSRWKDEITNAIRTGAFFLACFSDSAEAKERSYMREELALAIEELRLRSTDRAWFIPLLLSPCELPDRAIGGGARLSDLHFVDLSRDWQAGIAKLLDALVPPADQIRALREFAAAKAREGDDVARADALAHAVRLSPGDESLCIDHAIAAVGLDRMNEAVTTLERLAAVRPSSARVRYLLGVVPWRAGRHDEAIPALFRARQLNREDDLACFDCGALLYTLTRFDEAVDAFTACADTRPDSAVVARTLLRALLRTTTIDELFETATSALTQHGAHADFHEAIAVALLRKHKIASPVAMTDADLAQVPVFDAELRRALELDPRNPARAYRVAAMYNLAANHRGTEWAARRGLEHAPTAGHLHTLLGLALEYQDGHGDAAHHYVLGADRTLDVSLEDPFPVLDPQRRPFPLPEIRRYETVGIKVWGAASA